MASVLFMFCTEPRWMIKCVWDRAMGNTLSVTVGNVPELHCYQFFTINLLEGGFKVSVYSLLHPCHLCSELMWDLYQRWAELCLPQLPPGLELGGVRSILWDIRELGLELSLWWGCAGAVLQLSRKLWAWSRGKAKNSSCSLLSCVGTHVRGCN